jgi:hypothetical protein
MGLEIRDSIVGCSRIQGFDGMDIKDKGLELSDIMHKSWVVALHDVTTHVYWRS